MNNELENRLKELEKKTKDNSIHPIIHEVRYCIEKKQYQYQNQNYFWENDYDELPAEEIIDNLKLDEKSLGYRALILFMPSLNDYIPT